MRRRLEVFADKFGASERTMGGRFVAMAFD